jgi:hypothetical protein
MSKLTQAKLDDYYRRKEKHNKRSAKNFKDYGCMRTHESLADFYQVRRLPLMRVRSEK